MPARRVPPRAAPSCRAGGIGYTIIVALRMRTQKIYEPVLEDRLFHLLFPFVAYALLVVAAVLAWAYSRVALFLVAAAALVLLFAGIHNAWDTVMWHVFTRNRQEP